MLRFQVSGIISSFESIKAIHFTWLSVMEKIELLRKPVRNRKLEKKIMKLITVNDSGMIIYPGKGPEVDRTGSPAQFLIDWHLYKIGTKPLDYDIFVSQIN